MPGLSGSGRVRRFAAQSRASSVALIAGHGDIDRAVSAIKPGAFDIVEKPLDESRLREAVRSAAGEVRQEQIVDAKRADLRGRFDG